MKKIVLFFFFVFAFLGMKATHNRAGEITYRHLFGYTYEIKIVTCTKTSVIADREFLSINWGDVPTGAALDSLQRDSIFFFSDIDAQRNVYLGTHTYGGPGIYELSVVDPNRNGGVINIDNSITVPFCIVSTLIISPDVGLNNSVILLNPPKEQACLNKRWVHNPGAYDPDGDLLRFSLVDCRGDSCKPIPGYKLPHESTEQDDRFTINPETGDIVWEYPPELGEFNIAILIEEFRVNPFNGELVLMGSVTRDMQIEIINCVNNPPVFDPVPDTCVVAGELLTITVNATDPDGDSMVMTALGSPFYSENPASFVAFNGTGDFRWKTGCSDVKVYPHQVYFKVRDRHWQTPLTDIITWRIQVLAPPVEGFEANAFFNRVELMWDPHLCGAALSDSDADKIIYKIYRKIGTSDFEPDHCQTGLPPEAGYTEIGRSTGWQQSNFQDNDVAFGALYCYRIVCCFPNGTESIVSEEQCGFIEKFLPVITHVSVDSTDASDGQIFIDWSPPSALDTSIYLPPYQYKLYHATGDEDFEDTPVYTSGLGNNLLFGDTIFTHRGNLNTLETAHRYRVDFYTQGEKIVSSTPASSPFLEVTPADNRLILSLSAEVPWGNFRFNYYRLESGVFNLIGTSALPYFVDSALTNYQEYCYKVECVGEYDFKGLPSPLLNWSQEACAIPYDNVAPCPPVLTIDGDCETYLSLQWTNPNKSCADDVTEYRLYYKTTRDGAYEQVAVFSPAADTSATLYLEDLEQSLAGCFFITALDSLLPNPSGGFNQNESDPSNEICTDNCPIYTLPNVFSPNGDGQNDYFQPFYYRFIESVKCSIFNRWGGLVFETTEPAIMWNGRNQSGGEMSSDGVYYYIIEVNAVKLDGLLTFTLTGNIQLVGGDNQFKP